MQYRPLHRSTAGKALRAVPIVALRMRGRRQIWASLLLASASIGLLGAGSASASQRGIVLSPHDARAALERATRLLGGTRRHEAHHAQPAELTTTLLALSRSPPS